LTALWTFENRAKLDAFAEILKDKEIAYETSGHKSNDEGSDGLTLSVDEGDYVYAKRLLMRHRKRRTSRDLK